MLRFPKRKIVSKKIIKISNLFVWVSSIQGTVYVVGVS